MSQKVSITLAMVANTIDKTIILKKLIISIFIHWENLYRVNPDSGLVVHPIHIDLSLSIFNLLLSAQYGFRNIYIFLKTFF